MSNRLKIMIGAGAGLVLCVVCSLGAFAVVWMATQGFADVGNGLMESMRDEDYEGMWQTFHPNLKEEVLSAELLWNDFERQQLIPATWTFSFREVGEDGVGRLNGPVTFQNGFEGEVFILLEEVEGEWLVTSFALQAR